mmetsp:Transcript_43018/g.71494  ORF Transcript_43018/g.71494 Transcript_43018/m.71494 type:complete len:180 (+) Transcript_43018:112-651(+)
MLLVLFVVFSPLAAFQCILNLLLVQAQLLGGVYFIGSSYNTVSCIVLTLAIGVCVDYSLHIMEKARHTQTDSVAEGFVYALKSIGPEVLNSGMTTLIGISPLLWASSHAMRLVAKLSLMSIAYGLLHGLIVLPVMSCLVVPLARHLAEHILEHIRWAWDGNASSPKAFITPQQQTPALL